MRPCTSSFGPPGSRHLRSHHPGPLQLCHVTSDRGRGGVERETPNYALQQRTHSQTSACHACPLSPARCCSRSAWSLASSLSSTACSASSRSQPVGVGWGDENRVCSDMSWGLPGVSGRDRRIGPAKSTLDRQGKWGVSVSGVDDGKSGMFLGSPPLPATNLGPDELLPWCRQHRDGHAIGLGPPLLDQVRRGGHDLGLGSSAILGRAREELEIRRHDLRCHADIPNLMRMLW